MVVAPSPGIIARVATRVLRIAFITIIVVAVLLPLYSIWLVAFEGNPDVIHPVGPEVAKLVESGGTTWTPYLVEPSLENFLFLFNMRTWNLGIRNSVIISLTNTALCLLVAFPAAYIFSRVKFKFDGHFFFYVILQRMTPAGAFIIPLFIIFSSTGLYDTHAGIILAHAIFNLPLAIWILHGFMKDIPTDVDEAAFIDGYSVWGFWRRVYIPQLLPAIGVTAFFLWMFSWTEVLMANSISRSVAYPLTVQLLLALGQITTGVLYGQAAAAGVLSMIPGLMILYFVRHQIARGFMLGGRG